MSIDVMKKALEALERIGMKDWVERKESAITELKQVISEAEAAQQVDKPFGYVQYVDKYGDYEFNPHREGCRKHREVIPVYTRPEVEAQPESIQKAKQALDKVSYSKEKVDKITQEALDLPDVAVMVGYSSAKPKQQEWVGLTEDDADNIWNKYSDEMGYVSISESCDLIKEMEAKLKEKNTKKG